MKLIDLSKPIRYDRGDPFFMQVRIRHKRHATARLLVRALGLPFRLFPKDFVGWADDTITKMGVHSTTHIDAPWHYGPTSGGAPAKTIDEIPLERCIRPGVILDNAQGRLLMLRKRRFMAASKNEYACRRAIGTRLWPHALGPWAFWVLLRPG
jgi:hypothetical protein